METFKFILGSIVVLGLLGFVGSWAVGSMQSGSEYVKNQKIQKLEDENEELKQETEKLKTELSLLQTTEKAEVQPEQPKEEKPAEPVKKPTTPTTYKNQTLINELQKLVNAGVILKLKSAGPSVGSVQKFLNIYNKTSNKIDNDYGATTKTRVTAFQKAQGVSPQSGDTGKATLTKMIAWLKKQG
jgi:hypothetical protein